MEASAGASTAPAGVLDFSAETDRAVLAQGEVTVKIDGVCKRGSGEARLDLVPRPRVILDCRFDGAGPLLKVLTDPKMVSHVEFEGCLVPVIGAGGTWGSDGVLRAQWSPSPQPVDVLGDGDTTMRTIRALLFNLDLVQDVELSHGHWSVAVQSHGATFANQKAIREQGVCRHTHTVGIEKVGGGSISVDEAYQILEALRNFLSFTNGGACTLVCPGGFDANGEAVWSQWSAPYGAESVAFCWSGRKSAKPLAELFPGFMAKWVDEGWRDALRTAVWWYTVVNNGGVIDSGIVSAQIAMERLAYEYCVRERALVSERGFKRLPTADRYRMFLTSLAIPLDIAPSLADLASASKTGGRNWADVADALVSIRNQLVHSGRTHAHLASNCYTEAWLLAAWLLEASVLALCEFRGAYWNRISRKTESAPWGA